MIRARSLRFRPDRRLYPTVRAAGAVTRFAVLAVVVFTLAAATGSAVADATRSDPTSTVTEPVAATTATGQQGLLTAELGTVLIQLGVAGLVVSLAGMLLVAGWRHRW